MTTEITESRATAEAQAHEKIIECETCGYRWPSQSRMEQITCPNCQHKTGRNLVELRRTERAKWTCDGATTIEEMAQRHEEKANHLRTLDDEGWKLEGGVEDDYASLTYAVTEVTDNGD